MQLGFYVHMDNCIGCRTCEAACKQQNNLPLKVRWRRVRIVEGGQYPNPVRAFLSIACNHCTNPACLKVCPVGAYTKRKEDGLVVHDDAKCIGCRYCTWACPYGAPQYDEGRGIVTKCDFCRERLAQGKKPACVESCLGLALEYGNLDEFARKFPEVASEVIGFPDPTLTHPSVRFQKLKRSVPKLRRVENI